MCVLGLVSETGAISCPLCRTPYFLLLSKLSLCGLKDRQELALGYNYHFYCSISNSICTHHNVIFSSAVTFLLFNAHFWMGLLGQRSGKWKVTALRYLSPVLVLVLVFPALPCCFLHGTRKKWLLCMGWPGVLPTTKLRNADSSQWS